MFAFVNPNFNEIDGIEYSLITDSEENVPKEFLENEIIAPRYVNTDLDFEIGDLISRDGKHIIKNIKEEERDGGNGEL